jgi:hypothetical protein
VDVDMCYNSKEVKELDFSECKVVKIRLYHMCEVEIIKLYSIDSINNIFDIFKIYCKNVYIYNIAETKYLYLSFIKGLQNVYLPEGEYCIVYVDDYLNVIFWLRGSAFPATHFRELRWYSYIPVHDLVILDTTLETI